MHFSEGSGVPSLLWKSETVDVLISAPGMSLFTSVLFPTPECPPTILILSDIAA